MPKPPPDKDRIARILSDAKIYGDQDTCKRHKISSKTLKRYKIKSAGDHEVANKVQGLQNAVAKDLAEHYRSYLEEAKAARQRLLGRMLNLADLSENLHDVTGAYKIVNDGILAEQVVGEDDEVDDNGRRTVAGSGVAGEGRSVAQAQRAVDKLTH